MPAGHWQPAHGGGEHHKRILLGGGAHCGDFVVVAENLFGQNQIRLQQGLGCVLHGNPGQPAHFPEVLG